MHSDERPGRRAGNTSTLRSVVTASVFVASILAVGVNDARPFLVPTGVMCVKFNLRGSLKFRGPTAAGPAACKPTEIQLGTFNGETLQLTGINLQIVNGTGSTYASSGGNPGVGNLIIGY